MRIAITGSSGFIGRHLSDSFKQNGDTVIEVARTFNAVDCDRVYHLACPSSTTQINADPIYIMDTILDKTREALLICPSALFVNISSYGAGFIDNSAQGCYNLAKYTMELYLKHKNINYINCRLPSVYGPGMSDDSFIARCIAGNAYQPLDPDKMHYIAHIDDVVKSLINLTEVPVEEISLKEIYESFSTGRRGIYRTTPNTSFTCG